jgi:hypothetical protein
MSVYVLKEMVEKCNLIMNTEVSPYNEKFVELVTNCVNFKKMLNKPKCECKCNCGYNFQYECECCKCNFDYKFGVFLDIVYTVDSLLMKLEEYEKEYAINVAVQVFNTTEEKYESISLEDWLNNVSKRKKRMNEFAKKLKEIAKQLDIKNAEEWSLKYRKKLILRLEKCNCKKCQRKQNKLMKLNEK